MKKPVEAAAWKALAKLAQADQDKSRADWLAEIATSPLTPAINAAGIQFEFGRQRIGQPVLDQLVALAGEVDLSGWRERMFGGEVINNSEQRAVLHTALRTPLEQLNDALPRDVADTVRTERAQASALAEAVRNGDWRGWTGKPIKRVIHVGIGGSALGPQLVAAALCDAQLIDLDFADNIDPTVLDVILQSADPETTLCVIVSKSFTTNETQYNANRLRSWYLERGASKSDLANHFVAVSTNSDAMDNFGIPPANRLGMEDWVGGRFSVWSSVAVSLRIVLGNTAIERLLEGARAMDHHFLSAPWKQNAPFLSAALTLWNSNFLGAASHAVIPYARKLALLSDFLQQLEMESNGKRVYRDGTAIDTHSAPILWGGEGTIGQHAFHQLLHQGTRVFSADLILCGDPTAPAAQASADQQRWLLAHGIAQGEAFTVGRTADELADDETLSHRLIPGGRRTTTIVLDRIDAYNIGALLAHYEHKVFCHGILLGINSFDQWGVELGKVLGTRLFDELQPGASTPVEVSDHDLVTQQLIHTAKRLLKP